MNPVRVIETARHLKGRQIVGQLIHRARGIWEDPIGVLEWPAPSWPGCAWKPRKHFLAPPQPIDDIRSGRVTFLHRTHEIGSPPRWDRANLPKLWRYNLHYFDWLWGLPADDARMLVLNWIDHHTPGGGRVGWEPYPTSLRLMNWCAYFFAQHLNDCDNDIPARDTIWWSIYRQSEWLSRHLEVHLLGNHLLENAAALVVAGSCFKGDDARRWCRKGMQVLRQQLPEQVLPDGGHFERSPMYHCRLVYVLAMLRNIGRSEIDQLVEQPLSRAVAAMKQMCHPDGKIALLNDSAVGIYNDPSELAEYVGMTESAATGAFSLANTGYYGARGDDGSYVICDAAPIGPGYLPGHAHGDMLSFLSLHGQRVIVDSGVYDYERSDERAWCRSTRAHNTVEVGGKDQCDFWGAFRVGRRGTVHDVRFVPDSNGGFTLRARHDGYERVGPDVSHWRAFRWEPRGVLLIKDVLASSFATTVVSRFHLHPDCRIVEASFDRVRIAFAGEREFTISFVASGTLAIQDSIYCPEFGMKFSSKTVTWTARLPRGRRSVEIVTCIEGCDPQSLIERAGEMVRK